MLAALLHLLALAWSHREHAVASVAAFLVAYMTLPASTRARIEARSPRWRATIGLLRDVFPFLPGVPAHAKAIVAGSPELPVPMPSSSVAPEPPAPAALADVAEKAGAVAVFDSRPSIAPPPPAAPTPLRAVTLTGVVAADDNAAAYELARREVAAHGLFDASARQTIAPEVVAAARAASDEKAGEP